MVQIVICCSLFTLNVILNLLLYAVNINDIHVCVLLFFLAKMPEVGFPKDGNFFSFLFFSFFFFLFVSQSSYFKKLVKIKKRKGETDRNRERERERKKKIDTFPELSCFRKSGMNEW